MNSELRAITAPTISILAIICRNCELYSVASLQSRQTLLFERILKGMLLAPARLPLSRADEVKASREDSHSDWIAEHMVRVYIRRTASNISSHRLSFLGTFAKRVRIAGNQGNGNLSAAE